MATSPFQTIGIDLGTSHSALAWNEADSAPQLLDILQLEAQGQAFASALLPSVIYLPRPGEIPASDRILPWDQEGTTPLVGRWARELGALNPERAIVSSKSWLCYGGRGASASEPLLPGKSQDPGRRTPRQAARDLLQHLRLAWNAVHPGRDAGDAPLVLTVPASFDLIARQWTEDAAREAGWKDLTLLEEPLAAFYAWLQCQGESWRQHLKVGDLVLVCDLGGGTSDFSLIAVSEEHGDLRLDRVAVGRHLLLGGDNMDLALAYHLQDDRGLSLDHWQFQALVQQARRAKECLLAPEAPASYPIAIAGRGSQLFAQTLSLEVRREEVEALLVDGFFPLCEPTAEVPRSRNLGLQELGLPYEKDPGITRHLASFLREAQRNVQASSLLQARLGVAWDSKALSLMPSHVLFNGGVFHGARLRQRMTEVLRSWSSQDIKFLESASFDQAVALGAAAFAAIKQSGQKLRVKSGAARSYYIGIESNEPAIPGRRPKLQGLCVLPQGTEEGESLELPDHVLGLWTGEEVSFRLFSAPDRAGDQLGHMVRDASSELEELSPVSCRLTTAEQAAPEVLPVYLRSQLTELGTLQLAMQHQDSPQTWRLDFHLRPEHG
jgi:hypothetical protein